MMRKAFRRIRAAILLGLVWGLTWGIVGGAVMEGIVDPHGRIVDMWPQLLAIPGFLSGVTFGIALWVAEGRRRFDELSILRFTALGAVVGGLLGVVGLAIGAAPGFPLWLRALVSIGPVSVLSAASAAGSLAVAKRASRRELAGATTHRLGDGA